VVPVGGGQQPRDGDGGRAAAGDEGRGVDGVFEAVLGTYPTRTRTWAGLLGHHMGLA
jgi:hypothetical protein